MGRLMRGGGAAGAVLYVLKLHISIRIHISRGTRLVVDFNSGGHSQAMIFSFCWETHPSMRVPVVKLSETTPLPVRNLSELINDLGGLEPDLNGTSKPPLLRRMLTKQRTEPHRAFFHFECLYNAWFAFELTVRFLVSPCKRRFFRAPVNIIDVVATLLSFYLDFLLTRLQRENDILEFFSIIRIMRLFKLTRHSPGLKILHPHVQGERSRTHAPHLLPRHRHLRLPRLLRRTDPVQPQQPPSHPSPSDSGGSPWQPWATARWLRRHIWECLLGRSAQLVTAVLTIALPVPVIVSNFALLQARAELTILNGKHKLTLEKISGFCSQWVRLWMCWRDQVRGSYETTLYWRKSVSMPANATWDMRWLAAWNVIWKSHSTGWLENHTGAKQYMCDWCEKQFMQYTGLKNHLKVLTGEKPYSCDRCDERFSLKRTWKKHMIIIHSGEYPYVCRECDYKCVEKKNNIVSHMRRLNRGRVYARSVMGHLRMPCWGIIWRVIWGRHIT